MMTWRDTERCAIDHSSCMVIQQVVWGIDCCLKFSRGNLENIEISAKVLAFVLSSIGATIVLLASTNGFLITNDRLPVACILILLGIMIFIKTDRGLIREIQIDKKRNYLFLGTRDSFGRFRPSRSYSLDDLVSAFIRRSAKKDTLVTLHITTRRDDLPVGILKGTESDLLPVLNYLAEQRSKATAGWSRSSRIKTKDVIRDDFF